MSKVKTLRVSFENIGFASFVIWDTGLTSRAMN